MSGSDFLDIMLARSAPPALAGAAGGAGAGVQAVFDSSGLSLARPRTPSLFEPPGMFSPGSAGNGPVSLVEMVDETSAPPAVTVAASVPIGLAATPAPRATLAPPEHPIAAAMAPAIPAPPVHAGWQATIAPSPQPGAPAAAVTPPAPAPPFAPFARLAADASTLDSHAPRIAQHMTPSPSMERPQRPDTAGNDEPVLVPWSLSAGEAAHPPAPPLPVVQPSPGSLSLAQVERELASLRQAT